MSSSLSTAQRLAALMGKTVAEQANAGFSEVWRRSDLFQAIQSDEELMNFTDLMAMVVSEKSDTQMQIYYGAVHSYFNDPGHVNDLEKIRECLDLAVKAMAIEKVSVQSVADIKMEGMAKRALNGDQTEVSRAKGSAVPVEDPELPLLPKLVGDHLSKEEFVAGIYKTQVWYLSWPQSGFLDG